MGCPSKKRYQPGKRGDHFMSIFNLFSRLEDQGIHIRLEEKNLKIDAPKGKLNPVLIEEIKSKKQEIIRFLQEYVQEHENEAIIEPAEKKEYYGLSSAQKRLYILQQMDKQGIGYNIPFGLELEGQVDKHKLEDTFRRLLHRHESTRTSFEMKDDEPVQKIHEHVEFGIEYYDMKEVEAEQGTGERRVEGWKGRRVEEKEVPFGQISDACGDHSPKSQELRAKSFISSFIRPFDLSQSPLLRVGLIELPPQEGKAHKYILMLDMHHIISDGTSIEILTKEFMKLHAGESENLPTLRIQYKDYAQWQSSQRKQTGIKKQEEYWKKDFGIHGEIPVLNLPLDFPRPPVQSFTGRELKFEISSPDTGALKKLAHEAEATLYMVLLSIYTVFLSKLSNREDIIVGTPVAGRRHDRLRNIIGMFVNTLALRNFPGEEMKFIQFLQAVKDRALAAFAHQDYPFEELVEAVAKERDTGRNPLFDTLFVLQNVDIPALEIPGLSIKPYPLETGTSKFDLSLNAVETVRNLSFTFEYSSKLFREDTIQRFTGYFKRIIASVLENKEIKLSRIEMMPGEEKKKILIDFNDMEIEYPGDKTIHQLFEEQVNRTPARMALIGTAQEAHSMGMRFEGTGGLAPLSTITYKELNERSNRLACLLKEKGLWPDSIVALLVERSIEMIIGLLGILKAGGAYLPIDPAYPGERIDFMLKDSGAEILLKDNDLTIPPSTLLPFYPSQSSSLAYIIYTSGTTGRPKGCMVSHQNVVSLLKNKTSAFDFNENDVWTMFHRYNFDFSVWEMYGALLYGGKLIIIPKPITTNLEIYLQILKQEKVTVLNQTPSAFYRLSGIEMRQPDSRLNLRYVIFGGEALSPVKLKKWKEKYPAAKLVNMFGITETTIHVTYKEIKETDLESNTSNIGRPLPTLSAYVMDRDLNLQPIGIPGELCVTGEGVTRGYLNNPGLTSERFIYHRSYFYRSGDLTRWLANGDIEYLGRIDHQVKIRGFRIELGEIENQLINHHEIKDAVVILSKEKPDQPYLCAYFTADRNLPDTGLRDYLSKHLPDYMIPTYFVQVDKIPLTLNGKIDKKALPEPGLNLKENYTAPRDEIEKKLVEIWAGVLGCKSIGIDDNYFEIGGNSLSILAVNKKINQVFKKEVAVIDMFRYTTIRSLAHFLQHQEKSENFCPILPPAARGALFEKTAPLDPPQKLFISLDIAVIGMAGRFPGAKDIDEFWENLKNGVECTWFFNDLELETSGVDRHLLEDPGYVNSNALLEEIEYFDPAFFGYSPREAEIMDPQARMFHECAWNALEDAGYTPDTYEGLIGLYAGAMYNFDWETRVRLSGKVDVIGGFASWQLMNKDFLSMWVSYRLNLKGPAVFIQTSCSTSLTAVHLACQAIINGECDMALAGGVSVNLFEKTGYRYQEGMVLSPDGHCRAFDAKAAGAAAGNGLGIVVLKPLETAVNDNDHIYALVKGSAVNNDGIRKTGFTAPSIEGQAEVIIAAQKIARVEPGSITYVETHGTGTPLGDPLEIAALKLAFQRDPKNNKNGYCALGSVKTNIGHLDTAAGITGFIKTVLSIYHRVIPPSLHFENPNPKIDFKNSPFYVNTRLKEWKCDPYPIRAGVSSFGMGGTNVHVILEEAPVEIRDKEGTRGLTPLSNEESSKKYQLILLSAKTETALDKMTENLAGYLKNNLSMADAAYTLQVGRKVFEHRRMLVCSHSREAIELLSSPGSGKVHSLFNKETQRPVIFMFAGQGSQYIDMGRDLYDIEPVFKEEMDCCFEILDTLVNYNIKEILYPHPDCRGGSPCPPQDCVRAPGQGDHSAGLPGTGDSPLERGAPEGRGVSSINQTEIALPIIFIFEYALAKLLMNWGIKPQAMIGYSVGEYVPACLAGVFSLEDAISLLVLRGKLTRDIPAGAMLSVPLPEDQLKPWLDKDLSLAVVNGPSCVVSGPGEAVIRLEQQLKEKKLLGIRLNISHAMHSPMMDPILEQYEARLRQVSLNPPRVPFISDVTGTWIKKEEAVDPGYWIKQMRQPVRFAEGLKELLKEGKAIFVEIGPGSDLSTILRQQLNTGAEHRLMVLNTVRHPQQQVHDVYYLLNRIGRLWMYGTPIDWRAFHAGEKPKRISLPTYPYDRMAYPLEVQIPSIRLPRDQGKKSDLSEWFYIPGWKISPIPFRDSPAALESLNWLILGDDTRLTEKLVKKLQQHGQQVIPVTPGVEFGSKESGEYIGYTINPGEEPHYLRLLETLAARDRFPHRVVHLWGMMEWDKGGTDKNSEWYTRVREGVFNSLVYLTKAIGKQALDKKIQLNVVSSHMQGVNGNDLLYPEKALLLGPVRTIPREYPNIACRSIDFALDESVQIEPQEEQMVHRLWQETWWESSEDVAAYRGIHRLTQTYDPFPLKASDAFKTGPRLRPQGIYLVTGGLGGIGLTLAEYLARAVQARLILTGRSPFPSRNNWDQWLEQHNSKDFENDPIGPKIRKLKELEEIGAEVMVVSADVSDLRQMKEVIAAAENQWGKINGIVHCAGIVQGGLIQQVTPEQVLDGSRSKVSGTLVLDALFKETASNLDFFILCSSLNALLGVMGEVIYGAANAFLDAYALQKTSRDRVFTAAINWDAWQGIGFAREVEKRFASSENLSPLVENVFKFGMLASEGVEVFKRVLAADTPRLVVSTVDLFERFKAANAIETPTVVDFKEMNRSLNRYPRPELSIPYTPPENETQRLLCETWEKFLGIEQVGIHDNFFELGATSLAIVQVTAILKETLEKDIPVPTMYAYPTVKELARYLSGDTIETGASPGEIAQLEAISKGKNKLKQRKQRLKEDNLV
jgi:polyketide synthase PksJ